ncbi:glycerate kinase type-2 family protein [Magnetospirillum gryphiswaldense]|uniref:Hydroxypyruvate reductase n=1 Tax=Magnetospirillum gryphiswaldense TaxID=55518 RepID=A4U2H5_9PROT|nr:glycerate kinase [Magnetospirillum gryphiswaldense]AVM74139.1 Putative hydroxypyruvate reductase [Magnetospirillum gryphiswaldense MSR-1]AVM78042.1 Putative hydroxypyruvate reductase [Magnetospirillum gryphiswaldense]CAM77082.1 hydroxypyruvate reductase [Magnetospirillum gryphiswaldense MSR-1]
MHRLAATLLRQMLQTAIAAALPAQCLPAHLPPLPSNRLLVLGAGKAAAAMARVAEDHYGIPLEGLVVTRHGHGVACRSVRVMEAGHPLPDLYGQQAATHMMEMVRDLDADDLVLFLVSGGGSALLPLPAPGLSLDDKQAITRDLLKSGASIGEINIVRKHLSAIKGGRLAAAAWPARFLTLAISDVPGDDPAVIASGPGMADTSTCAQAQAILRHYGLPIPALDESPKPDDPRLQRAEARVIATAMASLNAAGTVAQAQGWQVLNLGDCIEGEARHVARVMAGMAKSIRHHGQPLAGPVALISGGETSVTLCGHGRGGRNTEFLLALALALDGLDGVYALAADTDGIDGSEDNAGALLTPDTLARAAKAGLNGAAMLDDNDAYGFFAALGDLVLTGPTRTNVNDFRVVLIP